MKSKVLSVPLQHRHSSVEACPKMPALRLFAELCCFHMYPSFITHWPLLCQNPSYWLTCSQRGDEGKVKFTSWITYFHISLVWSMRFLRDVFDPLKVKSQIMLLPTCKDCWIDHENMECISSRDQARHSCLSKGMWMEIRAFDNDITLRCTRSLISSPLQSHRPTYN